MRGELLKNNFFYCFKRLLLEMNQWYFAQNIQFKEIYDECKKKAFLPKCTGHGNSCIIAARVVSWIATVAWHNWITGRISGNSWPITSSIWPGRISDCTLLTDSLLFNCKSSGDDDGENNDQLKNIFRTF